MQTAKKTSLFATSKKDVLPKSSEANEGTINTKLALHDLDELFGSPSEDKVCFF